MGKFVNNPHEGDTTISARCEFFAACPDNNCPHIRPHQVRGFVPGMTTACGGYCGDPRRHSHCLMTKERFK